MMSNTNNGWSKWGIFQSDSNEFSFSPGRTTDIVLVALLYIATARIGQLFAIDPGNITPVWIPSGLMVAIALNKGPGIWPGVFIGAMAGNSWAYFDVNSFSTSFAAIGAGAFNGVGDVISTVVMACFILRFSGSDYPLTSLSKYYWYLAFAVIIGPFISAFIGVTALVIFGFSDVKAYGASLMTWFIGDSVGALLFGPLLLAWLRPKPKHYPYYNIVLGILVTISSTITAITFSLIQVNQWFIYLTILALPISLVTMINYGQRAVFTIQASVSAVAIYATSVGQGPFIQSTINTSLIQLQIFIAIFSLIIFVIALMTDERQKLFKEIEIRKQELEKLYRQDALTGLPNRYRIQEFVEREFQRFSKSNVIFGVILFDLDDFKKINDTHGHIVGDKILVKLCQSVMTHTRDRDLLGRWGGEEFIIVIPETDPRGLTVLAEKVRKSIEDENFDIPETVTVSMGASTIKPGDTELSLLERVDEALYISKLSGKNKVTFQS